MAVFRLLTRVIGLCHRQARTLLPPPPPGAASAPLLPVEDPHDNGTVPVRNFVNGKEVGRIALPLPKTLGQLREKVQPFTGDTDRGLLRLALMLNKSSDYGMLLIHNDDVIGDLLGETPVDVKLYRFNEASTNQLMTKASTVRKLLERRQHSRREACVDVAMYTTFVVFYILFVITTYTINRSHLPTNDLVVIIGAGGPMAFIGCVACWCLDKIMIVMITLRKGFPIITRDGAGEVIGLNMEPLAEGCWSAWVRRRVEYYSTGDPTPWTAPCLYERVTIVNDGGDVPWLRYG